MKLLFVVEASFAGVGRHVLDLAEALTARGHAVHLVYSPERAERRFLDRMASMPRLRAYAVSMRRAPCLRDLVALFQLIRYIVSNGPFDVIHGHSSKGGALARLAGLLCRIPAVYTPNAIITMDPTLSRVRCVVYGVVERVLSRIDGLIIAVSPEEHDHLLALGISAQRLSRIPNCIPALPNTDCRRTLSAFGLSTTAAYTVGFVGRLAPQKRPDLALKAFAIACDVMPDAQFVVLGDGPMLDSLRTLADNWPDPSRIRFVTDGDGAALISCLDVLVLPSRYEGLSFVLLEACAAGTPAVVTAGAVSGGVIRHMENGVIVDADADAVAHAICRLLRDEELRRRMRVAAKQVSLEFAFSAMITNTLQVYVTSRTRALTAWSWQPPAPSAPSPRR